MGRTRPPADAERRRRFETLNERQSDVLRCIRRHLHDHKRPPTRAELARDVAGGLTSSTIDHHLRQLARRGWIEVTPGEQRGLRLLREGVPVVDAVTGEGLDETDPDRPRIDGLEAVYGQKSDLFVRVGNNAMSGAGLGRGDLVAIAQNREPEPGDLVAARIDHAVEMRRLVRTHEGDMLEAEPEKWVTRKPGRIRADTDNVAILGVEIATEFRDVGDVRRTTVASDECGDVDEPWKGEYRLHPGCVRGAPPSGYGRAWGDVELRTNEYRSGTHRARTP